MNRPAGKVPRDVFVVGRELAIVWDDGREDYIPLEKLRRNCPCAMCKGETKARCLCLSSFSRFR